MTRLTAIFRNGTTLTVHPGAGGACGQQLHLAGFAYPASGVTRITAYSSGPFASTARETVPASLFRGAGDSGGPATGQPALRLVPGVWEHAGGTPPDTASGTIGSGHLAAVRWRVTMTLGAAGECFAGAAFGSGAYTSGTACQPIGPPPVTAVLRPLAFSVPSGLAGYGALVSPRTGTVAATLSNGTTERITPVTVGGRGYAALALPSGTTLSRLTLEDRSGHVFATVTSIPPRPATPPAGGSIPPARGNPRPTAGASWPIVSCMTVQSPLPGGPGLAQVRRLVTEIPGPCSRELLARREASVARGVSHVLPVFISAAGGGVLIDVNGNSLIDFGSGIAVASVGNSAPRVSAAIREQADRFTHTCFMVTPYEGYVSVCEELARLTPGDHEKRSALLNSGAEAVENAVKIARHATGRPAVIAFDHAYHGRTNLTMALTAKNMPYKDKFGPFAGEIYRMPMAYPLRWPGGPDACAANALDMITGLIHTQVGEDNVAAVLIEPIQGEGGFIVPPDGFLPGLAEFCQEHGILLIADEIQTGFCRTGDWFACDHEGVVPDMVTTAKGIAGGMPLAAVTGRAEIMDSVHTGGLGGTYGGNPVACAAALGAIETMAAEDLPGRARRIGEIMLPRLHKLAEAYPVIGDVRGRGAMIAIELVRPGTLEPAADIAARVARACHTAGLVVLTCGTFGNVLRFLPPLVIGEQLLEEGLSILEDAFAAL